MAQGRVYVIDVGPMVYVYSVVGLLHLYILFCQLPRIAEF